MSDGSAGSSSSAKRRRSAGSGKDGLSDGQTKISAFFKKQPLSLLGWENEWEQGTKGFEWDKNARQSMGNQNINQCSDSLGSPEAGRVVMEDIPQPAQPALVLSSALQRDIRELSHGSMGDPASRLCEDCQAMEQDEVPASPRAAMDAGDHSMLKDTRTIINTTDPSCAAITNAADSACAAVGMDKGDQVKMQEVVPAPDDCKPHDQLPVRDEDASPRASTEADSFMPPTIEASGSAAMDLDAVNCQEPQQPQVSEEDSTWQSARPRASFSRSDIWDHDHVRMPCSPRNVFRRDGTSRWQVMSTNLKSRQIGCFEDLRDCILSYAAENGRRWMFASLRSALVDVLNNDERTKFFNVVLPSTIDLALSLPHVCNEPIKLLTPGLSGTITLTQEQCACLLANAFLCTFPRAHNDEKLPSINFFGVFEADDERRRRQNRSKIRCILRYLEVIAERRAAGDRLQRQVIIHRRVLSKRPLEYALDGEAAGRDGELDWMQSKRGFAEVELEVKVSDTIEDFDLTGTTWQADFANKIIGGGVLGNGAVQEEIRFVLSPELIITRLVCPRMNDNESILVLGSERFSDYTGYAATFEYAGPHNDNAIEVETDAGGRRLATPVICFDALYFGSNKDQQYRSRHIIRELNKALCAFLPVCAFPKCMAPAKGSAFANPGGSGGRGQEQIPRIATGNWGCGAFGGEVVLKGLIQFMAAAQAKRKLIYMTFGDENLSKQLEDMYQLLMETNATVGGIASLLEEFRPNQALGNSYGQQLLSYLEYRLA